MRCVCLMEIWVEEKKWRTIEGKLPKGFIWQKQWAKKRNKKGRAMRGMLMGVKRGRKVKVVRRNEREKVEEI